MMADPLYDAVLGTAEIAVNHILRLDPESVRRLSALQGKRIEIRILAPEARFQVSAEAGGLRIERRSSHASDVVISGAPLALLRSAYGHPSSQRPLAEVEVSGDTEVAAAFRQLIEKLDIDWEEQLSHVVGDVIAHQIGNFVREFLHWSRDAHRTLEQDLSDYLREESEVLASRCLVEAFASGVDTLRADVDRLEQRLDRMERLLRSNEPAERTGA